MIELTRLNGRPMVLNSDLIKTAEASPDTMLTLINGEKLIVREEIARSRGAGAGLSRAAAGGRGAGGCTTSAIWSVRRRWPVSMLAGQPDGAPKSQSGGEPEIRRATALDRALCTFRGANNG